MAMRKAILVVFRDGIEVEVRAHFPHPTDNITTDQMARERVLKALIASPLVSKARVIGVL